jgi:pimeloyl-ACP methyl ester carboxylesterase
VRRYIQDSPERFDDLEAAIAWCTQSYPVLEDYPDQVVLDFVRYSVRDLDDGGFSWKFDPAFRDIDPNSLRDVDLYASAREVQCPTLIVHGAESDVVTGFVATQLRDAVKVAELVEVPGVGHAPSLVEPQVLAALERFLDQRQSA